MSLNKLIQKITNEALVLEAPRYKQEIPGLEPLEDYSHRQNYWHLKLEQYQNDPNAFVTFSKLPKLGINPTNTFNTPTGIYGYPLDKTKHIADFATERPYALVFKPKNPERMLTFFEYDSNESFYQSDVEKLKDYFEQKRGLIYDFSEFEKDARENAKFTTPSAWLWNLTRLLSQFIERQTQARRPDINVKSVFQWSQILYNILGYEGAYDNEGTGLIHENEPFQAVFFRSDAVELLELINKTNKETIHSAGFFIKNNKKRLETNNLKQKIKDKEEIFGIEFNLKMFKPKELMFNSIKLTNCKFKSGDLITNSLNATFDNCFFSMGLARVCTFKHCKFINCYFKDVLFANCIFDNCTFDRNMIDHVMLNRDCRFSNTAFVGCDFYKSSAVAEYFLENDLDIISLQSLGDPTNRNILYDQDGSTTNVGNELEKYAQAHGLTI